VSNESGEQNEPAPRASVIDVLAPPARYPDDGPISGKLRRVDHYAGVLEQAALFLILGAVVVTGTAQAISTKVFQHSLLWSFDIVRGGTFAIAMIGAAFASHQASHLSMDIVSRFVHPRKRLAMRVVLGVFTIFAAYLLLKSGLRLYERVASEGGHRGVIAIETIAMMIPVGSALIIFHTALRVLIDIDYLRRGKLPPEKAMTGH
jgi:TRAP-type C4-dicarboxylate transport system permease small subunit